MIEKNTILVHVCCASCACYVLPHLQEQFVVAAFYFNPNIHPDAEYRLRLEEMRALCRRIGVPFIEGTYQPETWWEAIEPYRNLPEKSERCWICYRIRLEETARMAADLDIEVITTTLSVSPHKIYTRIEAIGREAVARYGLTFYAEDFKKKDGFNISVDRSKELCLTRQDYCGCLLSREESKIRRQKKG
ncbi:MAG: epoxyqueuosine reductase QueH [bacterium]|nr:MAG: epoxyqueuosine reductase QueH [bacterium]